MPNPNKFFLFLNPNQTVMMWIVQKPVFIYLPSKFLVLEPLLHRLFKSIMLAAILMLFQELPDTTGALFAHIKLKPLRVLFQQMPDAIGALLQWPLWVLELEHLLQTEIIGLLWSPFSPIGSCLLYIRTVRIIECYITQTVFRVYLVV